MDLGPRRLEITMISAENLKFKGRRVYLVASLSGDESNEKQSTPVHKKGRTADRRLGPAFEFIVRDVDASVEFKLEKENTLGGVKKVVGEVDVPVMDLVALFVDQLANGCVGDMMTPKVLSCEVRSSVGETMAVLAFSCKFGERLSYEQNAAPPVPPHPSRNFLDRAIAWVPRSVLNDLGDS